MKIAIFGAGGVGGYFGGLLAQAGHDVTFIARGAHLETIQKNGLQVESVNGSFTIRPAQATNDSSTIGIVDYVIVCVKDYHLTGIIPAFKPLVGAHTTVVPLLNGIDAHDRLIAVFGERPIVGGLCSIVSMIKSPGVIYQASNLRKVVVGELDRVKSERVEKLIQVWAKQGAEAIHPDDIFVEIWSKFLFIASFGGVSSLARANVGEILGSPTTKQLFIEAMREIESLARAQDIQLPEGIIESTLTFTESFEPTTTSSMQRDVMAGRPFELDAFSGKVVHLGKKLGINTPVHRAIEGFLRPTWKMAMSM